MIFPKFFTIELNGLPPERRDKSFSKKFIQGMADRIGVSHHKYGDMEKSYPKKVNAVACLEERLERYKQDGNTEWLMDVANFAMIEFMYPAHPNAHYEPQDSDTSPGLRKWNENG